MVDALIPGIRLFMHGPTAGAAPPPATSDLSSLLGGRTSGQAQSPAPSESPAADNAKTGGPQAKGSMHSEDQAAPSKAEAARKQSIQQALSWQAEQNEMLESELKLMQENTENYQKLVKEQIDAVSAAI